VPFAELAGIKAALEALPLPEVVLKSSFTFGEDARGKPAVWGWFILSDNVKNTQLSDILILLQDRMRAALDQLGSEAWPYIRLSRESEQQDAGSPG
jgi:hypothetical protein